MKNKSLLYCIFCFFFASCGHSTIPKEINEVDTIFTTHSVTAVERGDTIEFLWRETSSEKCLSVNVRLDKKNVKGEFVLIQI